MAISIPEPAFEGIPPPEVLALVATDVPTNAPALAPSAHFPEPFTCRMSWVADAAIVEVRGEIDIATAPALENAIDSIRESPIQMVVVDLSQVSFLDSAALNTLTNCQNQLGEKEVALRVVLAPDQAIRKLFEITELIEPLGVVESIDQALRNR
jgi:anti-sigma B factor antagonist